MRHHHHLFFRNSSETPGIFHRVFTELPCSWSAPGQQGTAPWRAAPAELHVKEALEKGGQLLMVQKSGKLTS